MKKLFKNFTQRTVFEYFAIAGMLIVSVLVLILAINWSVDLAKGIPFFTAGSEEGRTVGEELVAYEWIVMILFYVCGVVTLSLCIYEAFFKKPTKLVKQEKEFIDGEYVDIKKEEEKFHDSLDSNTDESLRNLEDTLENKE